MAIEDWEKLPDGNLVVSHLMAWEAVIAPIAVALRLQTAATRSQFKAGDLSVLQLVLDSKQLRDLGDAFTKLADQLEEKQVDNQQRAN